MVLCSDSPLDHKLIKKDERDYIVEETQQSTKKANSNTKAQVEIRKKRLG